MKELLDDGRLLDTETGEVRTVPQPKWVRERPSPGEPRRGAQDDYRIPKQLPGGRELRGKKGKP